MKDETKQRLLTKEELAKALQVSEKTIQKFTQEGMPVFNLGHRSPRYDFNEVLEWLKRR